MQGLALISPCTTLHIILTSSYYVTFLVITIYNDANINYVQARVGCYTAWKWADQLLVNFFGFQFLVCMGECTSSV